MDTISIYIPLPDSVARVRNKPVNESLQPGDEIYWCTTNVSGNYTTTGGFQFLGILKEYEIQTGAMKLVVWIEADAALPGENKFIAFRKNKTANTSAVIGHYGTATFDVQTSSAAELYTAGCEIAESSK